MAGITWTRKLLRVYQESNLSKFHRVNLMIKIEFLMDLKNVRVWPNYLNLNGTIPEPDSPKIPFNKQVDHTIFSDFSDLSFLQTLLTSFSLVPSICEANKNGISRTSGPPGFSLTEM